MSAYELHDVFISYRRYEDGEKTDPRGLALAQDIYDFLTLKGLKVFWDRPEMQPGDFSAQLDWQLEHSPNYIFIATESAKRFRPDQKDYVEHELKTALKLYDACPADRIVLPVFPYIPLAEKQATHAKGPYPEEVQRLTEKFHGVELSGPRPTSENLKEILRYMTMINRSNIWNAGYQWLKQAKEHRFSGLSINSALLPQVNRYESVSFPINVSREGEGELPLMEVIRSTRRNLYLIGTGGIGKTTALLRIMEEAYDDGRDERQEQNRLNGQVPLFIELSRAPDVIPDDRGREWQVYSGGKSTFVHREIYRQVRRDLRLRQIHEGVLSQIDDIYKADYEVAVRPVVNLLGDDKPVPEYILLLDGLNEISRREIKKYNAHGELEFSRSVVSMVLDEIREIMKYKNVRVILTSRSKEASNWAEDTVLLDLSGVKAETIREYLTQRRVPQARIDAALGSARLRDVLRTPLFLIMYAELGGGEELLTAGEIMRLFFHKDRKGLYTQTARTDTVHNDVKDSSEGSEPSSRVTPEMIRFILDFILPEVAWRMVLAREFHIRGDSLGDGEDGLDGIIEKVLTDDSDESECGQYGGYAFPEYESEAYEDPAGLAAGMTERFGGMKRAIRTIRYCMVNTLGVLYEADHEYSFIHHHIRDYFAAAYHINRLKMAVYLQERKKGDMARDCLKEWREKPLPAGTRQFIGESLGEAHNTPVRGENGNWYNTVPDVPCERNLVRRAFDLFRDRFDGQDGYCVWNLFEILKAVRRDLSGEDFSALDMTLCEANGHAFGRKGLAAVLTGAKVNEQLFMPRGHEAAVSSAAFSADGRGIVTASYDRTAKIWDAETLQETGTLSGHTDGVACAAFSWDKRRIVTASWDRTAKVWDAETLQVIGTLTGHQGWVCSAAFSPDNSRIVTGSYDRTAKVWDAETQKEIKTLSGHADWVVSAVFSPDGRRIMTASRESVKIWDAETLLETGRLPGHEFAVESAAFSADGSRIVTTSWDQTAKIWDAETLREIGELSSGHKDTVRSAAFSPDGSRIVTASWDNTAKVWDVETQEETGTLHGHIKGVNSVVFSPDGHRILTASYDDTAKVWDAEMLQEAGTLYGHMDDVCSVEYSPDGSRILTASLDHVAKIWDAETLQQTGVLSGHTDAVYSATFSPDGRRIVTASLDQTAKIWDAETLREIGTLYGHTRSVNFAEFSPDGRKIVTASSDETAKLWDVETQKEIGNLPRKETSGSRRLYKPVNSVAFSPDGSKIVTVTGASAPRVWDAETLQELGTLSGHTKAVNSAMFSPDGHRIVTGSYDRTAKIWDADKLQELGTLSGHTDTVRFAVFSRDRQRIVTSSDDRTAKVWDVETLQKLGTLRGHTGRIATAAFSPDGRRIVTASDDKTAKVWDAGDFECIHTIHNVAGLELTGVDIRRLHSESRLTEEVRALLYEYGAVVDNRK